MDRLRFVKIVVVLIAAVTIFGCKSKQDAPGAQNAAPPQQGGAVKSISGQTVTGTVAASPKDKADAEAAAVKVLAQMEAGQFSEIYKAAAPTFQKIGPEAAFVAKFEETRKQVGPLKGTQQASFITLQDQSHVLVYHSENERFKTERRLSFARSKSGKMELFGLNQHDEQKKQVIAK
jgi:hypothetical protein